MSQQGLVRETGLLGGLLLPALAGLGLAFEQGGVGGGLCPEKGLQVGGELVGVLPGGANFLFQEVTIGLLGKRGNEGRNPSISIGVSSRSCSKEPLESMSTEPSEDTMMTSRDSSASMSSTDTSGSGVPGWAMATASATDGGSIAERLAQGKEGRKRGSDG